LYSEVHIVIRDVLNKYEGVFGYKLNNNPYMTFKHDIGTLLRAVKQLCVHAYTFRETILNSCIL